jgi:zinc protease
VFDAPRSCFFVRAKAFRGGMTLIKPHRMSSRLALSIALCLVTAGCGPKTPPKAATIKSAGPAPGHVTKVRSVEGIDEYVLPNGLRVLLVPDGTQATVTVNVTYFVGSLHEGYGETGMAHLLEHMTFKGTPAHHNIMKLIDSRGGHGNGSTWNDRTNYFETLAANDDNLDWALGLEADRMLHCTIAEDELKTEFSVVRNEFEMGENDPRGVLDERMTSTAYLWHNYGKSTIGSRADIERVPVPSLRAFYTKYYQPDNAMLVVSGKLQEAATLALIEKHFGAIPKPTRTLIPPYSVEPVQDGERAVTLRRNGDVAIVGATYHTVGGASPDYAAVSAAVSILTRKPSGRLYKALVPTKLAANVSGDDHPFRDPGLATFMAEVRDSKTLPKVRDVIVTTVEGLGSAKLDERELERWRNAELKEFDHLFADSESVAVQLSEYAALGDWRTIFAHREHVKSVTLADVARVAKTYFKSSNRTIGEFLPTKAPDRAPLTETPDVAAIVKKVEGGTGAERGEDFTATIDNIEARTERKHLKSGLDAAFVPKKNRGGRVLVGMRFRFGDAKTLTGKAMTARVLGDMLTRGTSKHDYQALRDAEDKARSDIHFFSRPGSLDVQVSSFREPLPEALDLVAEMLTASSFPASEFEVVRQEMLASLEKQLTDPNALAGTELAKITLPWPKEDPRYAMSAAEKIEALKKLTVDEVRALHRDLVGASYGQVVAIGDFDSAALANKLDAAFGSFASKKPYARLEHKAPRVASTTKSIDVKDKEMAAITFGSNLAIKDDHPDYPALLVLGQILGGDLGSRLWMRVREAEGLSYGIQANIEAEALDPVGYLTGYAIVAPQNADRALSSIQDEIRKAAAGAVTNEELTRAKEAWSKALDTNLSRDEYVGEQLLDGLFLKRTLTWWKDLRTKVQAVTAADIARVAKAHIAPDTFVLVKAGDFTKK